MAVVRSVNAGVAASGDRGVGGPPQAPAPPKGLPLILLWVVPFLLVLVYVVLVHEFFHDQARWTDARSLGIALVLLGVILAFSFVWFVVGLVSSRTLGVLVPLGVLLLIARLPGLNRHVVITPPQHPDTPAEMWGRFGALFVVTLGFELVYMVTVFQRGDLAPQIAINRPFSFFLEEVLTGVLLAVILAPAAPYLSSRARLRITDSLNFPFLWLTIILLVVGGATVLAVTLLPGVAFDTALFFTSILLYAPAAWFVALAFTWEETVAQNLFFRYAWKYRFSRFHFGRMKVTDEPEGTITEV
ncbi:MAG: hypothetical protein ABR888_03660 [Thermoplasmata archaeon]